MARLAIFFDRWLSRFIFITSFLVTATYFVAMLTLGSRDIGLILPSILACITTTAALLTCAAGILMMAAMDDKWLGNVQKFRLHLGLGCLSGALTAGFALSVEIVPRLQKAWNVIFP